MPATAASRGFLSKAVWIIKSINRYISIWLPVIALIALAACKGPEITPTASELASVGTDTPVADEIAATASETAEPTAAAALPLTATPRASTASPTLAATHTTPFAQVEANGDSYPTATPSLTPTVTPIPVPTSNVVEGWLMYQNDFFNYRFSYPPEARIRRQGVTGVPIEEVPENMTVEEYWEKLKELYPNNLCISVEYGTGFVIFVPSEEKGGRYTGPCGITGVGDDDIVSLSETVLIDGESYTASGVKFYERGTGAWQGEFYILKLNDHVAIHYGSLRGTQEQFLDAQETLLQIVTSFRVDG
ncbi:MAG: hypothetical protein R6X34_02985 [Chloroflexota bacterium]